MESQLVAIPHVQAHLHPIWGGFNIIEIFTFQVGTSVAYIYDFTFLVIVRVTYIFIIFLDEHILHQTHGNVKD